MVSCLHTTSVRGLQTSMCHPQLHLQTLMMIVAKWRICLFDDTNQTANARAPEHLLTIFANGVGCCTLPVPPLAIRAYTARSMEHASAAAVERSRTCTNHCDDTVVMSDAATRTICMPVETFVLNIVYHNVCAHTLALTLSTTVGRRRRAQCRRQRVAIVCPYRL